MAIERNGSHELPIQIGEYVQVILGSVPNANRLHMLGLRKKLSQIESVDFYIFELLTHFSNFSASS